MSRQLTVWISIFFALIGGTIAAEGVSVWQESIAVDASESAAFYAETYQPTEVIALSSESTERVAPN